jgi:hypothetical protein
MLPEIKQSILMPKSNCANSIEKFFNPDVELVKKLKFYNPDVFKSYRFSKDKEQQLELDVPSSLYSLRKSPFTSRKQSLYDMINKKRSNTEVSNNIEILDQTAMPELMERKTSLQSNIESDRGKGLNSIQEKSTYLKRIENLANENKLESSRKILSEKLKAEKSEITQMTQKILALSKDIENHKIEVEVLDNFAKFTEGLSSNSSIRKFEMLKSNRRQNTEDKEKLFLAASQMQKDIYKREKESVNLKQEIENKSLLKERLLGKVNELKSKHKITNEELKNVQNQLMLHYHVLLNEGRDTRQEGLSWIIKAIWNLGYDVIISYLPTFLDEKCIEYLFTVAHKDFELLQIKDYLDQMKANLKLFINRDKSYKKNKKQTQSTFKTDLQIINEDNSTVRERHHGHGSIMEKLRQRHSHLDIDPESKYNYKKIEEFINKKEKLSDDTLQLMKSIRELESVYEKFRKEMLQMKRTELNRIGREFLINEYERRFDITLQKVISAIAGEDFTNAELTRQMREQKVCIYIIII